MGLLNCGSNFDFVSGENGQRTETVLLWLFQYSTFGLRAVRFCVCVSLSGCFSEGLRSVHLTFSD